MKKLFENLRTYMNEQELLESRLSDVKAKYPELSAQIDKLSQVDPSGSNKYLPWMAKQLDIEAGNMRDQQKDSAAEAIAEVVNSFHNNLQRIKEKDINKYGTYYDLERTVNSLGISRTKEKKKEKEIAMEGADIVYKDNDLFVIRPYTTEASRYYGKDTAWCISYTDAPNQFTNYTSKGKAFYMVRLENLEEDDKFKKIAFVYDNKFKEDEPEDFFNATDQSVERSRVLSAFEDNLFSSDNSPENLSDAASAQYEKLTEIIGQHLSDHSVEIDYSEVEEVVKTFNQEAQYVSIQFSSEDETPYMNGNASIDLDNIVPEEKWLIDYKDEDYRNDIMKIVEDSLNSNSIYPDQIEAEDIKYNGRIFLDFYFESYANYRSVVEGYEDFISAMENIDANMESAIEDVVGGLEGEGYVTGPLTTIKSQMPDFEHLGVEISKGEIEFTFPFTIRIDNASEEEVKKIINSRQLVDEYILAIKDIIEKSNAQAQRQLRLFEQSSIEEIPSAAFEIRYESFDEITNILHAELVFTIERDDHEEQQNKVALFAKYLDENFDDFEELFAKTIMKVDNQSKNNPEA